MPRWIVFDQATATELRARLPKASVFEAPGRAVVEYALDSHNSHRSVVAVLPPVFGSGSAVAVFRPDRTPTSQPSPAKPSHIRAGGILGLNDESVLEEEEVAERSKWWQFWRE
jgi:hypothetical protein